MAGVAGAHHTVRIPFTVSAPFYGDYTVAGTVYGLPTATDFHADLDNDPWAAELLLPIALLVIAEILRLRDQRARAVRGCGSSGGSGGGSGHGRAADGLCRTAHRDMGGAATRSAAASTTSTMTGIDA